MAKGQQRSTREKKKPKTAKAKKSAPAAPAFAPPAYKTTQIALGRVGRK